MIEPSSVLTLEFKIFQKVDNRFVQGSVILYIYEFFKTERVREREIFHEDLKKVDEACVMLSGQILEI